MSNSFVIRLIRTDVGFEEGIVERLKEMDPNGITFKTFGKYDLLQVSELKDLHEAAEAITDPCILEINTFPCFCWYKPYKKFLRYLKSSISPTITLLKLQGPIFQNRGLKGIDRVAKDLCKGSKQIFILMGMGYHELLLFNFSDSFESIFPTLHKLRKYRIEDVISNFSSDHKDKALFSGTVTIPLISYEEVIEDHNWHKLQGIITPELSIKCMPGHEDYVAEIWKEQWRLMLGIDDIICFWENPIELKDYVRKLMNFRTGGKDNLSIFNTSTRLFHSELLVPDEDHAKKPSTC